MFEIATMLADAGLSLVSSLIDKGEDKAVGFIKDKTGIDLSKKKTISKEEIQRLKELEVRDKEILLQELDKYLQDKQNARSMRVETLTSEATPLFSKIFPDVLAGLSVIATFALFYIFASGMVKAEQKDIVLYILGLLSGVTSTIYAFYFGSSKGSQEKDKHIQRFAK